jgi:hypothetical protein
MTKTESSLSRETPTAYLQFVNTVLMQLWEIEYSHTHYIKIDDDKWQYNYTSYTVEEEWRKV